MFEGVHLTCEIIKNVEQGAIPDSAFDTNKFIGALLSRAECKSKQRHSSSTGILEDWRCFFL